MRDETLTDLRQRYAEAKAARAEFESDWYLNQAFFEGEQWIFWDGYRLARPTLARDRVRVTDNRVQPVIRTEVARLSKYRPVYNCTPRTGDDDDLTAATLSEQIAEYLWDHLGMSQRYYQALLWSRVNCAGFIKTVWDSTIGDSAEVLVNAEGRPILDAQQRPMRPSDGIDLAQLATQLGMPADAVRRKRIHRGDIRIVVRSPFEIYPDPLAASFEDLEWLIEETVQSQEYVLQRYGVLLEPDTPANPGMVQSALGGRRHGQSTYKGVRLFEYWRKPCTAHPNGYRAAWAADRLLERDEHPADPMPYDMLRGIDVPGRFWPTCLAEQLRPLQVELNLVKSQLAENRNRVGNATLVIPEGAVEDKAEFERQMSAAGGVAYYRPDMPGAVPAYVQPPQMPAYLTQEIDRIEAAIQEIAGQHEVSGAQVPAGVTAASAINLLQEADDTRLGPSIRALEGTLASCGRKQLELVARHYDDQRTISIAGEDDAWDVFGFRGDMLRGHTKVDVQAGSMYPRSTAAKQAAMESTLTTLLQCGRAPKDEDLARFFKAYDVGGVEHLVASFNVNQTQIQRENRQLMRAIDLAINAYDDDDAHILGHETWQRSAKYERLPANIKALADRHVQLHRTRRDERLAAQQTAQQPSNQPTTPPAPPAQ